MAFLRIPHRRSRFWCLTVALEEGPEKSTTTLGNLAHKPPGEYVREVIMSRIGNTVGSGPSQMPVALFPPLSVACFLMPTEWSIMVSITLGVSPRGGKVGLPGRNNKWTTKA